MATCALFIDYENVIRSLRGQGIQVTHRQLADTFRSEAARWGELVYARAYAPWDIYPEAMPILDRHDIKPEYVEGGRKDNADLVMSLEIQEFLRIPGRDAETFVLVTGDGDFLHVIRILQQENKRVVVWGVEGSISHRLASRVSELVSIQSLLAKHNALPAPPPPQSAGSGAPAWGSPGPNGMAQRALVIRAETVMLQRGWVQLPFLTLMQEMAGSSHFGEDAEQRRMLIVRGIEAGCLETKKQPNPKRPGTDTTFVLLRKECPQVAQTLRAVGRVIHHMKALQSEPGGGVPYSRLEQALAGDPDVPRDAAGEAGERAWIELCAAENVLRLEGGEQPVLRLVEEHPLVQQHCSCEDLTPMLRRLIIHVDHYLARTGYTWMSMGLLRRSLAPYGQKLMERSIRAAHEMGVLQIRQLPNQFGVRPTTGAFLNRENPAVGESLALRDRLVDAVLQAFGDSDAAAAQAVEEQVERLAPETGVDAAEWIAMLLSHQLMRRSDAAGGERSYLLNRQHPVVGRRSAVTR